MSLKILMADDEPDVLKIMAKKIADAGYEIVTAKDGMEAWELIQNTVPDIILLDLNMPRMDGFEVLKALRSYPASEKWQPVIIISTRGEFEDIQKGIALEAEHYLVKPCPIEDVIKAIEMMAKLIPHHRPTSDMDDEDIQVAE